MVKYPYPHIWDCCCDHGFLGIELLKQQHKKVGESERQSNIHFVDIVPTIMTQLSEKLSRHFLHQPLWHVHCLDVASLPLSEYPVSERHLIIIAGVGGELTQWFVKAIVAQNPQHQLEFLLCPLRQHYQLRKTLSELDLRLVDEQLLQENKRFYEMIHVTSDQNYPEVSLVGNKMWHGSGAVGQAYLSRTLTHYQKQQGQSLAEVKAYQQVIID
ncbi:SAM-dependent methyltransferase [Alteromonadales bacterium alter-6D02]|nr:SAM-dependent methyltransferase [Alteromonadales bacterium alter-6D02]